MKEKLKLESLKVVSFVTGNKILGGQTTDHPKKCPTENDEDCQTKDRNKCESANVYGGCTTTTS